MRPSESELMARTARHLSLHRRDDHDTEDADRIAKEAAQKRERTVQPHLQRAPEPKPFVEQKKERERQLPTSSGSIVIDDGVPIPPRSGELRGEAIPWASMKPGQSFFLPCPDKKTSIRIAKSVQQSACYFKKRRGVEFKTASRFVTENGKTGLRTWMR